MRYTIRRGRSGSDGRSEASSLQCRHGALQSWRRGHNPATVLGDVSCPGRAGGAKPVYVDTRQTAYKLSAHLVEEAITAATKVIIINSPNNPTGVVYNHASLLRFAELALKRKIRIVFDECYSELVRNGARHLNVVQLLGSVKEQTILVNSFSKS